MKKLLFIFTIFLFASFSSTAFSASISFSLPATVSVGDNFEVLINIDTDGILINSADIVLKYNQDLMSFAGYKSEDTVTPLWLASPHESDGNISMSGIIPGGVSGLYDPKNKGLRPIPFTQLIFTAKKDGNAKLSFIETKILMHDGKGTKLMHDQKNADFEIRKNIINDFSSEENIFDKISPEPFSVTFLESSLFSRTPGMLIFEAKDVDSGIKEYQIKLNADGWRSSKSPQPISKSIFSRNITVRAFDFYGNFQDANVNVPGLVSTKFLLISSLFLVLSGILVFKLLKYRA